MSEQYTEQIARSIEISVVSKFLEQQSAPDEQRFAFSYQITIQNNAPCSVQLLSRSWLITDADHQQTQVQGEGVVGQQPVIEAGKSFTYASGAVIKTPVGSMQGHYQFISDGELFQVAIPIFSLAIPHILN